MPIITGIQLPGPLAMALVFDRTGSYEVAFWSLAVLLTIGGLLVRRIRIPAQH